VGEGVGEERQERQLWDLCDIHHFSGARAAHTHQTRAAAHFAHAEMQMYFFRQNKNRANVQQKQQQPLSSQRTRQISRLSSAEEI
jgi:hypothetical protein